MGWKDFDIELNKQQGGDVKAMTDVDAIKNSLTNIVQTFQCSRRMIPNAFVDIYRTLFEPMDRYTAERLGNNILTAIEKWDDRIVIDAINVDADYDNNLYKIIIEFRITTSDEIETMEVILRAI
jgi:phage baseplate assembly protein W